MIAPATRTNLLSAQIDKAAILASYEQGLFSVGRLSALLDNYESLQEIAREGQWHPMDTAPAIHEGAFLVWCPERKNIYSAVRTVNFGHPEPRESVIAHFGGLGRPVTEPIASWTKLPEPPE